jgi:MFS transporter, MHS family, proline/betaine transporter
VESAVALRAVGSGRRSSTSATAAGAIGNVVEWYDFAVFGASASLLAAALSAGGALTGVWVAFALSFLVRPVGALVIGRRADVLGRRGVLVGMLVLMSLATAAIGVVPTYAVAGIVAPVVLVLLRVLQGFSGGGELVSSIPFVFEHAPPRRRGMWSGVHMATMALGFAAGSAVVAVVQRAAGASSAAEWAWRVPFLLAIPLGAIALYLRLRAAETPDFLDRPPGAPVARARLLADRLPEIVRGLLLAAGMSSSFNLFFVYLPNRLAVNGAAELSFLLACAGGGMVTLAASAVFCGWVSDLVGRGPVLLSAAAAASGVWLAATLLLTDATESVIAVLYVLMGAALGGFVLQSAISDLFPVQLRASGLAWSVGLGTAMVGGTAPLVVSLLDNALSPSIYAFVWLALACAASMRWPASIPGVPSSSSSKPPESSRSSRSSRSSKSSKSSSGIG